MHLSMNLEIVYLSWLSTCITNKDRRSLRTESCGTPLFIEAIPESKEFISTYYLLLE